MVYALLLAKSAQGIKLEYLKSVLLGGTAVTPELMRLCTEELGAHGIENAYGMTEGVFCTSGNQKPEALLNGSDVAVGRVQAGGRLKVCAPGSKVPLPCGQAGELHGSLPTTVRSYIGNPSEDFYEEHGHHWFRSGDQAVMDTDGRIFVVGRYKEMIIRGGENIAPAAIEACIYRELPQFKDRQVQIIGVADEIAGEVPLAIVAKPVDAEATKQIKDTVVSNMGTMYSIDDIIYIGDLGLEDYPRTMGQKVQKNKLTELVRTYRQRSDVSNDGLPNSQANSKLTEQVKQIWARTVGIEPADITLATDVSEFVDSITLMRVKDKLYKQTGINMTVQEILQARTIGKVINVMQSRAVTTVADENARFKPPDHAPTMDDMVHIFGDPVIYEATKAVITKAIKPHGLSWEDVRDVMPAYDFTELAFKNGTLERWAFKAAILANNCTIKDLRTALVKTLANNPMQTSFVVWDQQRLGDDIALQLTVDHSPDFLHGLIENKGTLSTVADFRRLALEMVMVQGATYPGPLTRAYLYYVEETECAGAIYNIHHAVTDATYGQLIFDDLDLALSGTALKSHVPYKLYCDNFYSLRNSPPARAATMYHVRKLQGLAQHKEHIFPPAGRPLQIEDGKPDGYMHTFSASGVHRLCQQHPRLAPSLVIKAATALFLLSVTGHTHAIFPHVEGGRDQFPFLPRSMAKAANLQASDIGGQLFQSVLNIVSLNPSETTLDFLTRLQDEQVTQTKYASAPWKEIMRGLDQESAALFPTLATNCFFNWLGSNIQGANAYTNIELLEAFIRRDVATFVNNASMVGGKDGDKIMLHLRGSVWSIEELRGFAEQIGAATAWLTDGKNWSRPVEEFRESMRSQSQNGTV